MRALFKEIILTFNLIQRTAQVFFDSVAGFEAGVVEDIKALWQDRGIQEAVHRANEFQYFDSTP